MRGKILKESVCPSSHANLLRINRSCGLTIPFHQGTPEFRERTRSAEHYPHTSHHPSWPKSGQAGPARGGGRGRGELRRVKPGVRRRLQAAGDGAEGHGEGGGGDRDPDEGDPGVPKGQGGAAAGDARAEVAQE